ncbi:transcriptional regulator, MerR family [Alloactinosynnema sp. L-07]|uniref:TetR/AcrR family transcriptional regulator n=1 Tax=Alloactinosynnema sp. L-07 TaxID=1653480 RepID=UPI00065F0414|nr:TetR/AcrR family transcriptional regulator [Alloactinosynnema sp. L-07]CRK58271.1 transcriptional regulator, MerR family [Alloactinosynnema sp. L-07]
MSETKRVTKRRTQTRQRLLDAALTVFAEQGFGASTVEQVCDRAGYTRGAFYSNFVSLDELFLAMWEQRSAEMLADLRATLVETPPTLEAAIEQLLAAIPVDDEWYRVTAEFTAHALRNPALKRVMAAREDAILETIMPILEPALATAGRVVPDRRAFGLALVAVHDGTATQCLMDPDDESIRAARHRLFATVVRAYSEEQS